MLGKLAEYDQAVETWSEYVERVNCFFDANDVKEERKRRSSSRLWGRQFTNSQRRRRLWSGSVSIPRVRQAGESVAKVRLGASSAVRFCNFGDTLDTMIRDRIVCGIQTRRSTTPLERKGPEAADAIDIAVSKETAVKNSLDLQGAFPSHLRPPCTKPFYQQREVGLPRVSSRNASGVGSSDHMPKACPQKG
ncbi:hypothetical protein JTE90_006331 [Oedothorax gibbosus]|uniref:Uncharacterized protein n=1 Tax=Oedothorax gibbosus TaxID=931172 RepID=A0AAV6TFB4_9ARAC|nr:hypothetical protein JTE90_006331 [Oedothorax gibbosus]